MIHIVGHEEFTAEPVADSATDQPLPRLPWPRT
ncbi:hypothetical protein SMD44_08925 [Streptomyces alboflavus]|uniref:Uncharacterized protein n=1 Tax=Streptomyces alboflavus TaxID=67267 RepID=A0A1Z1WSN2_9ACTN|nr:hypothetical protein SMD44_08925 [Streptomyces alboflavus]